MCVDDYEFRHISATRDKECRKFIFVDQEQFAKTYYVNISQFQQNGQVGLCKILLYLSTKGLIIQHKKFYLPKFNAIIEPYTYCKIIFEALDQKQIFMKVYTFDKDSEDIFQENQNAVYQYKSRPEDQENYFCRFENIQAQDAVYDLFYQNKEEKENSEHTKSQMSFMEEEQNPAVLDKMIDQSQEREEKIQKSQDLHKKQPKQAQRGIKQVMIAVKIWRGLYESKRCNLTNAAKIVGISKKSLDDYYLVLRVGQILGFDFNRNLNSLMGELRNFIRAQQQKVTGKLGKAVKSFDLVEEVDLDRIIYQFKENGGHFKE